MGALAGKPVLPETTAGQMQGVSVETPQNIKKNSPPATGLIGATGQVLPKNEKANQAEKGQAVTQTAIQVKSLNGSTGATGGRRRKRKSRRGQSKKRSRKHR